MYISSNRIGGEMKTRARQRSGPIKNALHLLLIAVAGLMPADRARAQTFTTLHDFTALSDAPTLTEPVRRPAWCWRGRHPVWGDALWRQFRRRHGVQSGHLAATGHHPFRNQRGVDVAGQCRRVHPGICDQSKFADILEHRFHGPGRHQRTEHRDQCRRRHTNVFPFESVMIIAKVLLP